MARFQQGNPGGPGRPAKRKTHAGAITRAEKQIADQLPRLIENMLVLANGVLIEEINIVTGKPQVYRKPPDRAANQYLIDRILGKPTERQEITGEDGAPVPIGFTTLLQRVYGDVDDDPDEGADTPEP